MIIGIDLTIVALGVVNDDRENVQVIRDNFNDGLRDAVGEYIMFITSLDVNAPDRIDKQLALLKQSDADICFCGATVEEGEDFNPAGYTGTIPPATVAVANICLSAAMFKTEKLRRNIGDEPIVKDNPYFWIKALRGAVCAPLCENLVSVFSNIPYNFRESYGTKQQAKFHPLTTYKSEYERIANSSVFKLASIPGKITKNIFKKK